MASLRQFFKFAATGTLGFIVDASLLYVTAGWLGWYGARILSFVCAATTTWTVNRLWTFQQSPGQSADTACAPLRTPIFQEYLKYLASMLGGAVLNYGSYVAVMHYGNTNSLAFSSAPLIGVAVGSIAGMFANFVAARYWVFKQK